MILNECMAPRDPRGRAHGDRWAGITADVAAGEGHRPVRGPRNLDIAPGP